MLVPELTLADPDAGATVLQTTFGFRREGGLFTRGNQVLRLVQGTTEGHGRIDHIALCVPDMDSALRELQAAGAVLDPAITPNGPDLIPEFWEDGIRYVYLSGPEGARIELCQRITGAAAEVGHDHIGIPCHDIAAMQAFFEGQDARLIASAELKRPNGSVPVRFLSYAGGVIELFQPKSPERANKGLWSRLCIGGISSEVAGPEGLILSPL